LVWRRRKEARSSCRHRHPDSKTKESSCQERSPNNPLSFKFRPENPLKFETGHLSPLSLKYRIIYPLSLAKAVSRGGLVTWTVELSEDRPRWQRFRSRTSQVRIRRGGQKEHGARKIPSSKPKARGPASRRRAHRRRTPMTRSRCWSWRSTACSRSYPRCLSPPWRASAWGTGADRCSMDNLSNRSTTSRGGGAACSALLE
jgi:hypothetical protein